jgi:hypothetical protein
MDNAANTINTNKEQPLTVINADPSSHNGTPHNNEKPSNNSGITQTAMRTSKHGCCDNCMEWLDMCVCCLGCCELIMLCIK